MKFTVVMPTHIINDRHIDLTKAAVASFGEVELIVIDDCSPMGGGYLRSIADTYVRNKSNLGYGRSVNKGLRLATTSYIAIANNDIIVSPNWQEVTEEVFKNEDAYSCHFRMTKYDAPFEYGNKILYSGKERWCHASFFVINRTKALFMYDEQYINTFDDWDYFQMVRKAGFKQAYTDKAQFRHLDSSTIPLIPKQGETTKKNYEYFKSKWGDTPEALFAKDFPDQMKVFYPDGFKL